MRYLSVAEIAKKWNMSERSVRNYCAKGRVNGAFLTGTFLKTQRNLSALTKEKKNRLRCWIF
jgi:transposase